MVGFGDHLYYDNKKEKKMKQYNSDKNCLNILRVAVVIVTVVLILLSRYFLSFIPKLMIFLNVLFVVAGFIAFFIYLPIFFKNLRYYVYEEKIEKVSGFFFIKKQVMSIKTIQYTTSVSTPLSRFTGLNFYVLYAYGGVMGIMFLKKRDFEELSFRFRK